jgi:hypothetical protein
MQLSLVKQFENQEPRVAERVSALRTEEYFQQRAGRADRAETLRILEKAGKGNPPMPGDELPPDWKTKSEFKKSKTPSGRRQKSGKHGRG